jgi:hypothetical protein
MKEFLTLNKKKMNKMNKMINKKVNSKIVLYLIILMKVESILQLT